MVIITDGAPRGRTDTPRLTMQYANELKEKGVLVVGAAVGPDRRKFLHILEELATSPKYVLEADFNQMDDILAKLVATSCIKPSKIISGTILASVQYCIFCSVLKVKVCSSRSIENLTV